MFAADLTDDALRRTTRLAAARLKMIEDQTQPVAAVKARLGGGGNDGEARRSWVAALRAKPLKQEKRTAAATLPCGNTLCTNCTSESTCGMPDEMPEKVPGDDPEMPEPVDEDFDLEGAAEEEDFDLEGAAEEEEDFDLESASVDFDLEIATLEGGAAEGVDNLGASDEYAAAQRACFGDFDDVSAVESALGRASPEKREAMQAALDEGVPRANAAREVLGYL